MMHDHTVTDFDNSNSHFSLESAQKRISHDLLIFGMLVGVYIIVEILISNDLEVSFITQTHSVDFLPLLK